MRLSLALLLLGFFGVSLPALVAAITSGQVQALTDICNTNHPSVWSSGSSSFTNCLGYAQGACSPDRPVANIVCNAIGDVVVLYYPLPPPQPLSLSLLLEIFKAL